MSVPAQAVAARLEALENDNAGEDPFAADSGDEEFVLRDDSDEGGGLAVLACQLALMCYRGRCGVPVVCRRLLPGGGPIA